MGRQRLHQTLLVPRGAGRLLGRGPRRDHGVHGDAQAPQAPHALRIEADDRGGAGADPRPFRRFLGGPLLRVERGPRPGRAGGDGPGGQGRRRGPQDRPPLPLRHGPPRHSPPGGRVPHCGGVSAAGGGGQEWRKTTDRKSVV